MNLEEIISHFALRILHKIVELMDENISYCRLKDIINES